MKLMKVIIRTQDKDIKEALIKLGWTPPGEARAIPYEVDIEDGFCSTSCPLRPYQRVRQQRVKSATTSKAKRCCAPGGLKTMDDFNKLLSMCKAGVHLTVNEHRNYYQSAEEALSEVESLGEGQGLCDAETRAKMVETNTIVDLQFYPDTPVGSYNIYHYDVDQAVKEGLSILEKRVKDNG